MILPAENGREAEVIAGIEVYPLRTLSLPNAHRRIVVAGVPSMSTHGVRFADLVEMIDRLPLDERECLVDVVRKRIAEEGRDRIASSIRSARREHRRGQSKPTTPDELMREIRG